MRKLSFNQKFQQRIVELNIIYLANKNRIKYSLGTILMAILTYYSCIHPEKYHILIPIVFGMMVVFGVALIATDKK